MYLMDGLQGLRFGIAIEPPEEKMKANTNVQR